MRIKAGNCLNYDHIGMLCIGDEVAGIVSEKTKAVDAFFNKTGFPHEVELFSGTVIKLGRQYGIDTPVNEYLYRKLTV